jgi:hypothetical protein
MAAEDGSSLNEVERKIRDILRAKLGRRATVTHVKQADGGSISIEVVSPNDFIWTGNALHEVADEIVESTQSELDVKLTTHWKPRLAGGSDTGHTGGS